MLRSAMLRFVTKLSYFVYTHTAYLIMPNQMHDDEASNEPTALRAEANILKETFSRK
jgi:hypothetical protein